MPGIGRGNLSEIIYRVKDRLILRRLRSLVHGRQVLHHARDLAQLCREVARVLKPDGWFVATREHVISRKEDLQAFLQSHALHKLYGGENALLLKEYRAAIMTSGLTIVKQFGPLDSAINYFPLTRTEWHQVCIAPIARLIGQPLAEALTSENSSAGRWLLAQVAHLRSELSRAPGRLYSFVARKA